MEEKTPVVNMDPFQEAVSVGGGVKTGLGKARRKR
jgi:hypothetical protein